MPTRGVPVNPNANPTRNPTVNPMQWGWGRYAPRAYAANMARAQEMARAGIVGPISVTSGETSPEWEFVKANKWYLLGGALLVGAGIAYAVKH